MKGARGAGAGEGPPVQAAKLKQASHTHALRARAAQLWHAFMPLRSSMESSLSPLLSNPEAYFSSGA